MSISDLGLALVYPAILSVSAVYAGCSVLCRRRRARAGQHTPGVHPVFRERQIDVANRIVRAEMIAGHAERIVAAEYERIGAFYDQPAQDAARAVVERARVNALFHP